MRTDPSVTQTITQPANTNFNIVTSGTGQAQGNGSQFCTASNAACSAGSLPTLGVLFNATTFTSLTGFTANGTTPSVTGGALVFTGGTGTYTKSLDFNQYTTLPLWSESGNITVGTMGSSTNGLGFGVRSYEVGGATYSVAGYVDMSTSANAGYVFIVGIASGTSNPLAQSATTLIMSAGDNIQLSMTRNYNVVTVTATDLTTNEVPVSVSYNYSVAAGAASSLLPNLGRFAVYNFGGTQTLTSLNISSNATVGNDVIVVGDSKSVPYYAGLFANGWTTALQSSIRELTEAGGSDQTGDVLLNLPEIEALKPKNVVLAISRNDYCSGVPLSTIEANYSSAVSQLTTLGIGVYNMLPLFETVCNQSALISWISSTYPTTSFSANIQPGFSASSPDGVHPGPPEQSVIYNATAAYLQSKGVNFVYPTYQQYELATGNLFPNHIQVGGPLENLNGGTYQMGYGFPETDTTSRRVGALAQSNDTSQPFGLFAYVQGNATPGSEIATLQTGHDGADNLGHFNLQAFGGYLNMGSYTANTETTMISGLGRINFVIPVAYEAFSPLGIAWGMDLATNNLTTANYGWAFIHTPGTSTGADDFSLYVAPPPSGTALSKVVTFRGDLTATFPGKVVLGLATSTVGGKLICVLDGTNCPGGFVFNTTTSVGTTTINAGTCTSATTVTMAGLASTNTINFTATTDSSVIAGWGSPTSGLLYITVYPSSGSLSYKVCNDTASNITPGAITFNVSAK